MIARTSETRTTIEVTSPPEPARVTTEVGVRFRSGDLEALGEVFDQFSGPVTSVVRSIIRDQAQVDDAVQETFLRAWRGAASFDPARPLGPWLFTIARRTAIDQVRREGRPNRSNHDELSGDIPIQSPGIEQAWETWEVRSALEQLPQEEAAIMKLYHYHALTHPQIADHLGIPIGTVKSRSHRAHQRLAGLLSHMLDDGSDGPSARGANGRTPSTNGEEVGR